MESFAGRCECGDIRFRVDGPIHDFSHCHCSQCRRLHGAAFATFAGVWKKDFRYLGDTSRLAKYASSETHQRVFCSKCGSNIMVELSDEPEAFYLSMGAVDGDPPHPPAYHIFVGSKAPWHTFIDTAAQHDEFPRDDLFEAEHAQDEISEDERSEDERLEDERSEYERAEDE